MKGSKIIKITALVLLISIVFIILGGIIFAVIVTKDINLNKNELEVYAAETKFNDVGGNRIMLPQEYKIVTPISEISPYIVNAFVALEDKRFYTHHGLDYRRIVGAMINNIKAGYMKEGGSTITQQLAKNAILTNEKSLVRKLKEAKLARQIEKRYSKDEIMEMYLNTIYFGHSLYGVRSATERLFGKSPKDVSVSEAAILAGIVKNPKRNSPLNSVENALERRDLVLKLMKEQGYIGDDEYNSAVSEGYTEPTVLSADSEYLKYAESAAEEAAKILGISEKALLTGGFTVNTYMNADIQKSVYNIRNDKNLKVSEANSTELIAENLTGGIIAYDSDVSYNPMEFRRSPGSTLKPFMAYLPALESGKYSPISPILDEKTVFGDYSPKNYQNIYSGWCSINDAVISSANVPAVKLASEFGIDHVRNFAEKFGLSFNSKDGLSAVLGGMTDGVTVTELGEAYMTLASGGVHKELTFVKSIEKNGEIIYMHNPESTRVISAESAYLMTFMLENAAKKGTAKKLSSIGCIAAKTGTNGDDTANYDAWCASYTPEYTSISTYFGKAMPLSVTGGGMPTMLTLKIMQTLPVSSEEFTVPEGVTYADIDGYLYDNSHMLKLASENTPYEYRKSAIFSEKFIPEPSDYFNDPLPTDFDLKRGDGELILSFTAGDKFIIKVTDLNRNEIYRAQPGAGFVELAIPETAVGIVGYKLSAETSDGVFIAETNPKLAFIFYSNSKLFGNRNRFRIR